ncbi:MAG: sulfite exporter TauE/SafE family protein [Cyclobacteriaceae bacterium]|nr:sulfite exporter TauE/SafE family protein [Cyclobacteriaceae bacterium]
MLLTALMIGLAGSLHCVGMCSPLALGVSGMSRNFVVARFLYNGGRILTYGGLGALVGAFGAIAGLTQYQTLLSASLGVLLVLLGVGGISVIRIPVLTPALQGLSNWLKARFASQVKSKSIIAMMVMGSINGLLPCGLTYFALTYCITLPDATSGFQFMVFFGLGTLPVMLGIPAVLSFLGSRLKMGIQRVTVAVMILLGVLLIVRSVLVHPKEMPAASAQSEVVCP